MHLFKHLLLIDNDEHIHEMIPFTFDQRNYLIKTIAGIVSIKTLISEFMPDIMLWAEDGQEICRNLKRLPALAHIHVIYFLQQLLMKTISTAVVIY